MSTCGTKCTFFRVSCTWMDELRLKEFYKVAQQTFNSTKNAENTTKANKNTPNKSYLNLRTEKFIFLRFLKMKKKMQHDKTFANF